MIKAVLWDFDGTLADTKSVIVNSWKYIYRQLENRDVTMEELEDSFGEPLRKSLEKRFPNVRVEDAIEIYRRYQQENQEKDFTPFPKVKAMLELLKSKSIKMALVTSRGSKSTIEGLKEAGIYEYFQELITADMVENHKPNKEPLEKAMKLLGVKPAETLMIGDTLFDLMAAVNAKTKKAIVGWSELDISKIEEVYKPDFILEDEHSIEKVLSQA